MQRDPKDAGAAQEKFPFLVSSVMSRRILKKQELSPQCSSGEVPVPRLTCHIKENFVKQGAEPPSSVDQEARSSLDYTCQANPRSR